MTIFDEEIPLVYRGMSREQASREAQRIILQSVRLDASGKPQEIGEWHSLVPKLAALQRVMETRG